MNHFHNNLNIKMEYRQSDTLYNGMTIYNSMIYYYYDKTQESYKMIFYKNNNI